MKRLDVEFASERDTCAAWLYVPDGNGPFAAVVLAHGWTGVREQRLDAYAARFADAGLAALVFDYRHFGASSGQPRQLLDIKRQLADWAAAVSFARSRAEIDSARIAVWGTSFSGGHVVETAARDPQIAAVVAQAPFADGLRNLPSLFITKLLPFPITLLNLFKHSLTLPTTTPLIRLPIADSPKLLRRFQPIVQTPLTYLIIMIQKPARSGNTSGFVSDRRTLVRVPH